MLFKMLPGSPTSDILSLLDRVPAETSCVVSHGAAGRGAGFAVLGVSVVAEVSEPVAVFSSLASVAGAAEPQAFVDIPSAFDFSVPVSLFAGEGYSHGRPTFPAFPNVGYHAISSSYYEGAGH
ncbi:MAG: hypothetical protein AB1442_06505, partial [Nitrospirota bacterium]